MIDTTRTKLIRQLRQNTQDHFFSLSLIFFRFRSFFFAFAFVLVSFSIFQFCRNFQFRCDSRGRKIDANINNLTQQNDVKYFISNNDGKSHRSRVRR